jgi:tRNA(Ile)-lysidine synthase
LDRAAAEKTAGRGMRLKQTLAGALVSLIDGRIRVEPAPHRRRTTLKP